MHDVFISYSHKDEKIREAVCKKLESEGISCWYAPRNIQPGEEWADAISAALRQCKVMLLIFTDASNNSNQVLREVGLAVDFKKSIIPFKCDDAIPTGSMQYYLSTLHWLTAPGDPESVLDELADLTRKALTEDRNFDPKAASGQTKAVSKKFVLSIVLPLFLLNIGIFIFLYSRGYFRHDIVPDEKPIAVELRELIDQGVVMASGGDIHSVQLESFQRWVVVNNKLYYFSPDLESPDADDYLYALLDDNTIRLTGYNGIGKTEITIPEMVEGLPVTSIGADCFLDNTEIRKVIISDTVDFIGANAFSGCTNLHEVVFPETLLAIDDEAFSESGLTEVLLKDALEEIGEGVFGGCSKLETVNLPEKISLIPYGTFLETPNLKTVTIEALKPLIDIDAFDAESSVTLIGVPGSYTEKYAEQKGFNFQPLEAEVTE